MALPQNDPANTGAGPIYQDNDFIRGTQMRANNQAIWENLEHLNGIDLAQIASLTGTDKILTSRAGAYGWSEIAEFVPPGMTWDGSGNISILNDVIIGAAGAAGTMLHLKGAAPDITFEDTDGGNVFKAGNVDGLWRLRNITEDRNALSFNTYGYMVVGFDRSEFYNNVENVDNFQNEFAMVGGGDTFWYAPYFTVARRRGTSMGETVIVEDGDVLGGMIFKGCDGDDLTTRAGVISCSVEGTPGVGVMPGKITISTTPAGSGVPTPGIIVDSNQRVAAVGGIDAGNNGTFVKTYYVEPPNWNMNANIFIEIDYTDIGVTEGENILGVFCTVSKSADIVEHLFGTGTSGQAGGTWITNDVSDVLVLQRTTGGKFDLASYDDAEVRVTVFYK